MLPSTSPPRKFCDIAEKELAEAFGRPAVAEHTMPNHGISRRLVLKIDAVILLQLVIIATLEFLDKNSLAYAAILGLKTETHVNQEYS
jgi:hypothetical protein